MTNVPLKAKVNCADDSCGESIAVVMNPDGRQVTHLVLEDKSLPSPSTRIIPIEQIADSSSTEISLNLTKAETATMDPFVELHHIQVERPVPGGSSMTPYASEPQMETVDVETEEEAIPEGEVALHRGSKVEASDGTIGQVGELIVNPETGALDSIVMLEGHFWDKKAVRLPASAIDSVTSDTIYLKLDKESVRELQDMPLNEYYSGRADGSAHGW